MQLKRKEILELFCSSIDNAFYLFKTASNVATQLKGKKYPSLGLAELALEELGKSYSCLAMYSKCETASSTEWSNFWKAWKNHDLKAHRAFFYEFFCLLRLEIDFEGEPLKFPSIRDDFSKEKEAAFYVDIDKGNRKIHKPEIEISDDECMRRVASLVGLVNATAHIKDWMTSNKPEDYKNAISDYAYTTLNTEIYQQDVLNVLGGMKGSNLEYNNGIDLIEELFTTGTTSIVGDEH